MRAARILAMVLVLAAIAAGAAYLFRLPLAGMAVRAGMASAGLENPQARVTALSLNGARLEEVSAGPAASPAFSFDAIEADYSWRRLWKERRVEALRAGPGSVRLKVDTEGRVSIAGMETRGGGDSGGGLPFDGVSLGDVALFVEGPAGDATGKLDFEYDLHTGGEGSIDLSADEFSLSGLKLNNSNARLILTLSENGEAAFSVEAKSDSDLPGYRIANAMITIDGEGASWRDIAIGETDGIAGAARVFFEIPDLVFIKNAANPLMTPPQMEMLLGEDIRKGSLSGAVNVTLNEAGLRIASIEGRTPLLLETPVGASLALTPQDDAPLYNRTNDRKSSALRFAFDSDGVRFSGAADIEQQGEEWSIAAPFKIEAFNSDALSLDESNIELSASSNGEMIAADVAVQSTLKTAEIGRLAVMDMPFAGAFIVKADMAGQRAEVVSKSDCLSVPRGRGVLAERDLEARLSGVTLCNAEGPLLTVSWMDDVVYRLSGDVTARDGFLRFAQTQAAGRPPAIKFDTTYHPNRNTTLLEGRLAGGAMTLNDALDFSGAAGRFSLTLEKSAMRASSVIDRLRVAQHLEGDDITMIAPMLASGNVSLAGNDASFRYVLTTLDGLRLGAGEGVHDMRTASGETIFNLGALVLDPDGLEPNRIFPSLKGIVDAAAGGVDGSIQFAWSPEGITSGASFDFQDISFGGPTKAVTRTSGFNGELKLASLFPVKTSGLQTVTVDLVDLDALQLREGEIAFEFPGDNTIRLSRGEFPWFGGSLGVYEATASLSGEAVIPMKAVNVELKQVFDYVDIDGLSGEGVLSGELPLMFEGGKARIVKGLLRSEGPGAVRYRGAAAQQAAAAGEDAQIAFDILRNLRYNALEVRVNGALDGRLEFQMEFEGAGDVTVRNQNVANVPVIYRISLDAALLELLRQANLSRDIELQIERGLAEEE